MVLPPISNSAKNAGKVSKYCLLLVPQSREKFRYGIMNSKHISNAQACVFTKIDSPGRNFYRLRKGDQAFYLVGSKMKSGVPFSFGTLLLGMQKQSTRGRSHVNKPPLQSQ